MEELLYSLFSPELIISLCLVAVMFILWGLIRKGKARYRKNHEQLSGEKATAAGVAFGILKFAVLIFGVILILQVYGVNVSAMIAGLGIASAIVGLALQDFLRDIIMGINILSERFFSLGECVEFEGREGKIIALTLRTTKIEDLEDGSVTTVSNRNISQIRRLEEWLDVDVPLSYREDPQRVEAVLADIAGHISGQPGVRQCRPLGAQTFADSAILYRLRISCLPRDRADVRRAALKQVRLGLDREGISIPFPQMDVHFDPGK